ncbi:hypothetical protein DYB32_007603 [Aphanomyces invadans]|uniref:TRAF-type domain-containing protein n=1 Tax=Aphanomyces invadans TaxID=157072 RepID=A0A3R6WHW1_9STRA|nr:hypothetical protein DYB32_007603 [Aphanomyces invadans]
MQVPAIELTLHLRNCDHRMVCCGAGSAQCARPLKAWIKHAVLDRCFAHLEHGFMWAVKTADMDTISTFLRYIHPSALDEEFHTGFTPLALACSKGDVPVVRILLLHGADVNLETSRGRTPLSEACLGQHIEVVEMLLQHRAVVTHTNRHGLSTMSIARQLRHDGILTLLEKRHHLEETQRRLFLAISTSNYTAIEELVAGGEMAYRENHAWHLSRELAASATALEEIRATLADHMNEMNVSIADSEAKKMKVVKILDSVEYNKAQLEHVEKKEAKVEALRQATELTVKHAIQAITAQDIVGLIGQTDPPPGLLVVLKAMALFNGVIPRVKRGTDVNGFSEKEWWETCQAMLMDRHFLRKLVNFRELDVPPDVLFKVRRECLKHDDFPVVADFAPSVVPPSVDGASNTPLQAKTLPTRRKMAMTPFMALSTWVKGVEVNQKSKAEAKLLSETKAAVQSDLAMLEAELKNATFDMKTAHRSLPSRQEELDRIVALEAKAAADWKLKQKRVNVCALLAFTSLNGHTPLTFAASIGNERAVRLLLNRGANGSYSSLALGEARMRRVAFREKIGWDVNPSTGRTIHDDTRQELDAILAATTKLQETKRQEQVTRKTILRRASNQRLLHDKLDLAIQNKAYGEAYALLDAGAFAEHATRGGLTVLCQYFLDRAVNRPSPNHESQSADGHSFLPLLVAAHYGTVRCGRSLDVHGKTAWTYAAAVHNESVRALLAQAAADIRHTLHVDGMSDEFGLCRWGCGYVGRFEDPIVEAGHIVRLQHPLDDHERMLCPKRLGCTKKIRVIDMADHVTAACGRRVVQCSKCHIDMTADDLDHGHPDCTARILPCGACGVGGIVADNMARHKADECKMRLVSCKHARDGCMKQPLFAHEKTFHETMECRYRVIWCPLGCGLHLVAKALQSHEAECPMRFSTCSLGCGLDMREKDRLDHEQFDCRYQKR